MIAMIATMFAFVVMIAATLSPITMVSAALIATMPTIVMMIATTISAVASPMVVLPASPVVPVPVIATVPYDGLVSAAPVTCISFAIYRMTHPWVTVVNYNFIPMIQVVITIPVWQILPVHPNIVI